MYLEFFGLKQNPFRARASSGDVFVGPQQARMMSRLKKALAEPDAVVTMTGQVGVGKSISAQRALEAISGQKSVIRIGRMPLGRDDILELLVGELDSSGATHSRLQRFETFNRLLNEHDDANARVIIIVEDAVRLGIDSLAELESLTSADSGETNGANLVLLAPPEFGEMMKSPEVARLRQRIRLRQTIEPFTPAEIRGYLAHRLREAGGELDALFAAGSVEALHKCAEGIPRVVNGLCSAALVAAAEAKSNTVSAALIETVAQEEFGFEAHATAVTPTAPVSSDASNPDAPTSPPPEPPKDDFDIPDLIQDTMPEIEALKLPEATKTPAEVIAELRDKTNNTEPSLPVLDLADTRLPPADPTSKLDEVAKAAEELRMRLEPHAPEPLSKDSGQADTQTIKALDSALRPDTQLLEALEEPVPVLQDNSPVPLGLQSEAATLEPAATSGTGTETLPTLSASMRLDAPVQEPKKPDINALEAALAVARKGPIDLNDGIAAAPVDQPEPPVTQTTAPAPAAAAPATAAAPAAAPKPAVAKPPPVSNGMPEITLDHSIQRQQEEAQARLAEKAAAEAAAAKAKAPPPPSPAELAAAAELAAEKKRLSGMSSISAQLSTDDVLAPQATKAEEPTPEEADKPENEGDQQRLEKLAADLGNATSLEDIDDMAAETLFGEEFSQIAATIAAMAANDTQSDVADDNVAENVKVNDGSEPMALAVELTLEDDLSLDDAASEVTSKPAAAPAKPTMAPQATAPASPAVASPAAANPAVTAAAAPPIPTPGTAKAPRVPLPPHGDIDSSAARRLEMVRSLNKKRTPVVNAPAAQEIVLGDDSAPVSTGPKPEPIENQFGTSMTANLKALSMQNVEAMQKAEEEKEEKKGGLLSRFKRS